MKTMMTIKSSLEWFTQNLDNKPFLLKMFVVSLIILVAGLLSMDTVTNIILAVCAGTFIFSTTVLFICIMHQVRNTGEVDFKSFINQKEVAKDGVARKQEQQPSEAGTGTEVRDPSSTD